MEKEMGNWQQKELQIINSKMFAIIVNQSDKIDKSLKLTMF